MAHESILIVEDDADIRELLKVLLEADGYQTVLCGSAEEALTKLERTLPDLMLLDLMLPGEDGLSFCRRIRADRRLQRLPVIMVTARSEESKIVAGLEVGADDYVTKPFAADVLLARVRAVLRRVAGADATEQPGSVIVRGAVELDVDQVSLKVAGKPVDLTHGELRCLQLLMRRPGMVFSRGAIVNQIHGPDYPVTDRAVDVMIVGLRRKLGPYAEAIETVRGFGYRWRAH